MNSAVDVAQQKLWLEKIRPAYLLSHPSNVAALAELFRRDGTACDVHETGRLVITSLRNYATPLLRYQIGDYGALGEPCSCGRGMPVLQAINGRVRNMLQLPCGAAS